MLVQVFGWHFGDEELTSVGVRSGVCHCQAARNIEVKIRIEFIIEAVTGIARARSRGIAGLDHELRYYAMKDRSIVERLVVHLFLVLRIGPVLCAFSQSDEVGHRLSLPLKKLARDSSHGRIDDDRRSIRLNQCGSRSLRSIGQGFPLPAWSFPVQKQPLRRRPGQSVQ